jgi:hypothetical protein
LNLLSAARRVSPRGAGSCSPVYAYRRFSAFPQTARRIPPFVPSGLLFLSDAAGGAFFAAFAGMRRRYFPELYNEFRKMEKQMLHTPCFEGTCLSCFLFDGDQPFPEIALPAELFIL